MEAFKETPRYVRKERVNKWPNSMKDIRWWWSVYDDDDDDDDDDDLYKGIKIHTQGFKERNKIRNSTANYNV